MPIAATISTTEILAPRALAGRAAIVTGSTSGIGLGIATALAAQGADVVLNGFGDPAEVEAVRRALSETYGIRTEFSPADMSRPPEIRRMVVDAMEAFGAVDILINNAGIQAVAPVEEFPDDRWDAVLAVNLSAAFHATKAVVPGMKRRGWGRIVNIASAHGLVGSHGKAAYVAAKHGILGLTKVVALDHANSGITCNAICPGWVLTPLVQRQVAEKAAKEGSTVTAATEALLAEKQPMLAFSTPEALGALTVFLCSEAAATMTGTALPMDGGWTAR
jgi:3-hydroxybutyrate dehydrogenase